MKTVAFLACSATMGDPTTRRPDAFEHDLEVASFVPAFAELGRELTVVRWDDQSIEWSAFEAAIVGTTWDYVTRLDEFLATLAIIDGSTNLFNAFPTIVWNSKKTYLRDLDAAGVPIVPTIFIDSVSPGELQKCFRAFGCERLVVKHPISASAAGQSLVWRHQMEYVADGGPRLVQAFEPSIQTEGELSLVFVGSRFSHAVRKRPASGDYRVQSLYGGEEAPATPSEEALEVSAAALTQCPSPTLFARCDLIRLRDGRLAVLELEAVEPYLYPSFGVGLGRRIAQEYSAAVVESERSRRSNEEMRDPIRRSIALQRP